MMKGILGKKVGMTQVFDEKGEIVPVTVIEAGPCYVTQIRTEEKDGYRAVQLGFEEVHKPRRISRGERGHLGVLKTDSRHARRRGLGGVPVLRHLRELRVSEGESYTEGQKITVEAVFQAGDQVDIVGTSKGRGFAGGVKRHGFRGGPITHGQSDRQRSPGSIAPTTTPGRIHKGKRMAGHMGSERVTTQNLKVVQVDAERNLLTVRGTVPGANGGLVIITVSRKTGK
jgi:large subunit ribosomal protein L3